MGSISWHRPPQSNIFAGGLTFSSIFQKEGGRKEIGTNICLDGFTMFHVE